MLFHVDVIIFFVLTCCADSKVSERLAAYPILRSFLRGRLWLLTTFHALFRSPASARLCTCLFMLRSSNRGLIWTSRRRNRLVHCVSVAEADVRVRVRGRVVSVDVQRRQVRVVRVVTTAKTAHQRQCSRLIVPKNSTSPATATPIRLRHLVAGLDFLYCGSGTAAIHKPQQKPAGVYR